MQEQISNMTEKMKEMATLAGFTKKPESKEGEPQLTTSTLTGDGTTDPSSSFNNEIAIIANKIVDMLIKKNKAYGDSVSNPVRIFSKADRIEQIKVRIDDKLSRIGRGSDMNEDTLSDLIGYLIILKRELEKK